MKFGSNCLIISLFVSSLCFQCKTDGPISIQEYYYPVEQLDSGLVYEYELRRGDQLSIPDYWYYRNAYADEKIFLIGQNYGPNLQVSQFVREEISTSGSLLRESYLMTDPDSLGKQSRLMMEINHKNVFPFRVQDSLGVYLYDINFQEDSVHYQVIRNRRFLGKEKRVVMGEEMDCVVFDLKELTIVSSNGTQEFEWRGKEYYAKGIGLVHAFKMLSKEDVSTHQHYTLKKRYPMDELVQKLEPINY